MLTHHSRQSSAHRRGEPIPLLARGWVARALVAAWAALLSVLAAAYPTGPSAAAQTTSPAQRLPTNPLTAGCSIVSQIPGNHPVTAIACSPGFASEYDQLFVYSRSSDDPGAHESTGLNMTDAVWLFTTHGSDAVRLIIDFHPNPNGPGLVAALYDDQDEDRAVAYTIEGGLPRPVESPLPTIKVVASDGWWVRDGKLNYNLEIDVDGQLQGSFGSSAFYRRMKTDGVLDFRIVVRDENHDGWPDWELIRAYPPISATSAVLRSVLMVSTRGDRPIDEYVFWPFLGISGGLQEGFVGGQTKPYVADTGRVYGLIKDYNHSFAPIQVAWNNAKVLYIGEFVASRGSGSNWFTYSLTPFGIDGDTLANFENPFAFYDLAGVDDGYPDLSVRQEYYYPGDIHFRNEVKGPLDRSIQNIRYTWDQNHDHRWDYKLGLAGRHPIESTVTVGSIALKTIPYDQFPTWVTGRAWDIAEFVAADRGTWTTEGIYESLFKEIPLRNRYLTGVAGQAPEGSYGIAPPPGYRGEYSLALGAQPYLYLSSIDRMLHLQGSEEGVWNQGARQVRYRKLGGAHLNQWVLREGEDEIASLTLIAGQLILSDGSAVRIKSVDVPPALFTTLPPTNHDEWAQLGALLDQHKAPFPGDNLVAMFDQFAGPVQVISGARVADFRATTDGFRTALDLSEASFVDGPLLGGLDPGRYVLHYRSGRYSAEVLTGSMLELLPEAPAGARPMEWHTLELSVAVRNAGGEDVQRVPIALSATLSGGPSISLGPVLVDVPGGESTDARFAWTPPAAGEWVIEATADGVESTGAAVTLAVQLAPASGLHSLLATQAFEPRTATLVGSLLAISILLAGGLGFGLWHGHELSPPRAATGVGHGHARQTNLPAIQKRDGMSGPSGQRG